MIKKVEISNVNTSKLPMLKQEEKEELLKKIKIGDEEARITFINGNLRLVLSVVKKFYNRGENLDDIFQVGCIGLIKAMDNFDLGQNVQFSTYAVPMILGEIRRYLRDNNTIRVSRSVRDIAYHAISVKETLSKNSQKEPTIEEIAKAMNIPKEEIVMCLEAIQDPVSLQEPVYNENGDNIYVIDQISDKKASDEMWAENITITQIVKRLNKKEKMIVDKRFFEGRTQNEVAEELGISQAQVSRLEKNAIEHIRRIYK